MNFLTFLRAHFQIATLEVKQEIFLTARELQVHHKHYML